MTKKILIIVTICVVVVIGFLIVRTKYAETKRSEMATNLVDAAIKKLDVDPQMQKKKLCV